MPASEVLDLVVTGKLNKVIAYELGASQHTVEIRRARVMEKMYAASLAHLVRLHMELKSRSPLADLQLRADNDHYRFARI
jgi:FixJ family two-component response regulator